MVSGSVPLFDKPHYNVSVSETHPPMIPFITLKAESPNGRQVFYNIESGNENDEFALDFNTGMSFTFFFSFLFCSQKRGEKKV